MKPKRLVRSYTGKVENQQLESRYRKGRGREEGDKPGSKREYERNFGQRSNEVN